MKEFAEILGAYRTLAETGARCALATVVAVQGSSYRKPGARMLIAEDGRTWGGVSGGCLERDVARRALAAIETGRSSVCRYDTADEQEDGFGPVGPALGCHGIIDIFIETISPSVGVLPPQLQSLDDANRRRPARAIATLLRATTGSDLPAGTRVGLNTTDADVDQFPTTNALVAAAVRAAWHTTMPGVVSVEGSGDWFVETLQPPQRVICFGAGPDVVPVVAIGQSLGWHMHVVATRPAPRAAERFAHADRLIVNDPDDPARDLSLEDQDAIILMTHNYPRDARILEGIFRRACPMYLGILGPRHRAERLLRETSIGDRIDRTRLHAPIGLDLGAQNPEQIALAIIAEITATVNHASGRRLRDVSSSSVQPRADASAAVQPRRSETCPT